MRRDAVQPRAQMHRGVDFRRGQNLEALLRDVLGLGWVAQNASAGSEGHGRVPIDDLEDDVERLTEQVRIFLR